VPRLPRRSAARCNPINAVSRLRFPGQSGSSRQTMPSARRLSVARDRFASACIRKIARSALSPKADIGSDVAHVCE
jgi:hypothetical protein